MSGLSIIHSGYWHPPPDTIPPQSYTQGLHMNPVIPYKVFSSWNSKDVRIISAKESRDYSLKNERRKSHSPKELQAWSSNEKTKFPFQVLVHLLPSLWHSTRSEFGWELKYLLHCNFLSQVVIHNPRSCNQVAHSLADCGARLGSGTVSVRDSIPVCTQTLLTRDLASVA